MSAEAKSTPGSFMLPTPGLASKKVVVAARAPEAVGKPILYPIAVVKDSSHSEAAKSFVAFVLSPEGTQILKKHGFLVAR